MIEEEETFGRAFRAGSGDPRRTTESGHANVRDRDDELATLVSVLLLLSEDFFREIPRQEQAIVRTIGEQLLGIVDF